MSKSLTKAGASPASALIPPRFPLEGLLCMEPKHVTNNLQLQRRDEIEFRNQHRKMLQAKGEADSGMPCCKTLHITLAFDGTNNNDKADSASTPPSSSNIARIFHASLGGDEDSQTQGYFNYYCPGVGTVFPDVNEYQPRQMGLVGSSGGENRINWGLTRLLDALKRTLEKEEFDIDETKGLLEKMSTNWLGNVLSAGLLENGEKKLEAILRPIIDDFEKKLIKLRESDTKPQLLAMRLYVYGFSRGAAEARTFVNWLQTLVRCKATNGSVEYRLAGLPISVNFLGICDTVAAVGIADSTPFAAGHMDWADGTMRLPDDDGSNCQDTTLPDDCHFLRRCVHLVSAHEQRGSFPLDSIRRRPKTADGRRDTQQPSSYRHDTFEYLYPGVHSDVGGGYSPGDQGKAVSGTELLLSQIPLHHLYAEAFKAGAPLQVPESSLQEGVHDKWRGMKGNLISEFDFSKTLVTRFNAWQSQAKGGTLEEMMKREQSLITGWRIDRYAGGLKQVDFFTKLRPDMTEVERDTWKRIHTRRSEDSAITLKKKPPLIYTDAENAQHEADIASVGGIQEVKKMHLEKDFDPRLDQRQLLNAAAEFRHDYRQEWGGVEDGFTVAGVVDMLLGGTVYLINEEDEAEEYAYLYKEGTSRYQQMFSAPGKPKVGKEDLVALFDDQVHDSRAWFMNSDPVMGPREPFTDYFRIRLVHFDNESNKQLSLLATAGRVVGVGIALASIGLSIKKKDPRMLLGLFLPSLARPVLSGKVGLPEISAFDPLTGVALPMLTNLDSLRSYTKEPGDMVAKVAALPALQPLTAANANTPALQKILVAHQAVEAARKKDASALASLAAKAANDEDKPGGWMDMVADQAGKLNSSEKTV